MRLTNEERIVIKTILWDLDPQAQIYLFGSRTDDNSRGGDIDLLVISDTIQEKDRRSIKLALYDKLGEQKIDLVIAKDLSRPFVRIAYKNGIPL